MLTPKLKAILLVSILVIAIGIPVVIYATTIHGATNEKPIAKISSPTLGYINLPVKFSASNSYDPDGYIAIFVWDFGDGTSSAGKYVNHTYMKVGNYTVKLTVYDNSGDSSNTTKKIEIKYYKEKAEVVSVNHLVTHPSQYMGKKIKVHGVFGYGSNYSFYLVNKSSFRGVRVYAEPGSKRPETINYGDMVEVVGRFTAYNDELEIKVTNESSDYIAVIGHGGKIIYTNVNDSNWEEHNNSFVHMVSKVTEVYASYKYAIGDIVVYISFGANSTGSPAVGDIFEVQGFLTYYHSSKYGYGYHEIYIRNNTADFSRYVSSNYSTVKLSALLNTPENYNGSAIHVPEGYVTQANVSWSFYIGTTPNSSKTLKVYVEKGGEIDGMIFNGAKLELWGTLTLYHGAWEFKIRNATEDRINVLNRPVYQDVPVETLLANPSQYNGTNVHSWGIVSWLYRNASSNFTLFGLFHNGSEAKVVGFNGSNITNIEEGYYADVYGEFTYYNGSWELKVRPYSYDYSIGRPQNYEDVNITNILQAPADYNNTLVHVPYAVVTYVYNASWLFYVSNSSSNSNDISVYIEKGGNVSGNIYNGAKVEIWGMVTQYNNKWEIKIRNNTNDSVKIKTANVNYQDVNITDILNNASRYNNTDVHIPNATVVGVYSSHLFWVSNSSSNSNDISVYVDYDVSMPNIGTGDIVEIYGNVTTHNGSYEIKVRSGTPDKVIVVYSSAEYVNFSYIHEVDANGTMLYIGEQVIVNGTVIAPPDVFSYTSSSSGKPILKMYIEGKDGGVQVFGYDLDYTQLNLGEGDVVQVRGTLDQYNGEAELKVSSLNYIEKINHTSPVNPENLTTGYFSNWTAAEKIEGTLVHVNGTVTSVNTTYNYFYIDDGSGSIEIYVKANGVNMTNISKGDNVSIVGVVAQYDKSSPYTSYYEIMPRYQNDIVKLKAGKVHENKKVGNIHNFQYVEVIEIWKRKSTVLIVEDMLAH